MKDPILYDYREVSARVDEHFFNNNFIKQNLALNLLWIFSKQRILSSNSKVQQVCSWLYENINSRVNSDSFELISAFTIVALEKLTTILNELPSIRSCLSNSERDQVKNKLNELTIDDRVLNFRESVQFEQLNKLSSIPVVRSFLDNYDELLEIATSDDSQESLDQILQYILTVHDVIPDKEGVLGLVDDLYALEQLTIDKDSYDLNSMKWKFEMEFPDFQYPILIDKAGNNLVNRADGLIKTALYFSDDIHSKFKTFFINESGPFSMLATILGSITNLKLERNIQSIPNVAKLVVGETYILIKGPLAVAVKFSSIFDRDGQTFYMFQTNGATIQIPPTVINKSYLNRSTGQLSQENKVTEFIKEVSYDIHGMFPFGLADNLDINFEKTFLVDRKNKIDMYLDTEIEGKTIREWFGVRTINNSLEETFSHGWLSNEPLITVAYSLKSLIQYLSKNQMEAEDSPLLLKSGDFHSLNLITDTNIDLNIENLSYLQSVYHEPFKTVNIYTNQDSEYAKKHYQDLGFLTFEEERSFQQKFVNPPKNSLFENYLSKVGAYPDINFIKIENSLLDEFYELLNIRLDKEFVKLKRYLFEIRRKILTRYSQLTSNGKLAFSEDLDSKVNRLKSYTHAHENIEKIIQFIDSNKEFLCDFETFNSTKNMNLQSEDSVFLVTDVELARLRSKGWDENHINRLQLREISQLKKIIIPAFTNASTIKDLIYYPYAEQIVFIASEFEIENFLKPLLNKRDLIKSQKNKDIKSITEETTEFEEIFLELDFDFVSLRQSGDQYHEDLHESRIFIFESNEYLALPLGGKTIITKELSNIIPELHTVNSIEEGVYLIRPITNHGDLQDSILDATISNILDIREKAFLWKTELNNAFVDGKKTIEDLMELLNESGMGKHIVTVKNWFKSPTLIAPDKPEKIFKIFSKFLELDDSYFDETFVAVNALYKARNQVLKDLPHYLKDADFDVANRQLSFQINDKMFDANVYEVLSYKDTEVSFDNLYRVKDLEDHD